MVHLRVSKEDLSLRTMALVDSGATCSFLPQDLAEALDLPVMETQTVVGGGGKFKAYQTRADLSVLKGYSPILEFSDCPVMVPTTKAGLPYAVLGRDTVFQSVQITFRERDQKTILKSY